jgi:uncharacterized OsmC-like protein
MHGMNSATSSDVRSRQDPLRTSYRTEPEAARITDQARTFGNMATDPFHGRVAPGQPAYGVEIPFGIHSAVGGYHDAPNPGDLLCAALAACLDSTIRIVAERAGVRLATLAVEVVGDLDVRGTLQVDRTVPVGFQRLKCKVEIQTDPGADAAAVQRVLTAAEQSCVTLQTLRAGVPVETTLFSSGVPQPA